MEGGMIRMRLPAREFVRRRPGSLSCPKILEPATKHRSKRLQPSGRPYILISAASTMASAISRMDLRSFMLFC